MKWLSTIKHVDADHIVVEKMALDDTGFPQPTGETEILASDSVVLALGQDTDLSLLDGVAGIDITDGVVHVDDGLMTAHPGIFAGGDMVPAERTATVAIGHGKKAAQRIDAWLRGTSYTAGPKHDTADFDRLNTWYYSDAPHMIRPRLEAARRATTFDEVVQPLDERTALFEARRCMSCGNCFECDNCFGVCPDTAVTKLGDGLRYAFDYDYCKGCGVCATECPAGAISMVPESI
jgi:2-oxoacid:acceptor oxidoreductase delta subunit (pyruvate/2-ketoisovalerate family)